MDNVLKEMKRRGAYHAVTGIKLADREVSIDTIYFKSYGDFMEWSDLQRRIYDDVDGVIAIEAVHII